MKEKRTIYKATNYVPISMSKNIKKNLPMVIASNCFSKPHKKGIAEKFKNRYNQSES